MAVLQLRLEKVLEEVCMVVLVALSEMVCNPVMEELLAEVCMVVSEMASPYSSVELKNSGFLRLLEIQH
jgi:hypothetical protein